MADLELTVQVKQSLAQPCLVDDTVDLDIQVKDTLERVESVKKTLTIEVR